MSAAAPGPLVGNPKVSVALLIFQLETPPAWALYNRNMEFGKKEIKIKNKKMGFGPESVDDYNNC